VRLVHELVSERNHLVGENFLVGAFEQARKIFWTVVSLHEGWMQGQLSGHAVQFQRTSALTPTEGTTLARLMALFLNFCLGDTSPPEEREDGGAMPC
jgi:hypothetical protein